VHKWILVLAKVLETVYLGVQKWILVLARLLETVCLGAQKVDFGVG
jgi:hypothetical protein